MPVALKAIGRARGEFEHPAAFWFGVLASAVGVALHLPMYFGARDMHYSMSGMHPDAAMTTGMALILVGLAATLYGVLPARGSEIRRSARRIRVTAIDDAPIRGQHIALLVVLAIAITIDVMKPATLSFVAPGVAQEYGLKSPWPRAGWPDGSPRPTAGASSGSSACPRDCCSSR
jgi:putative MFS transporter